MEIVISSLQIIELQTVIASLRGARVCIRHPLFQEIKNPKLFYRVSELDKEINIFTAHKVVEMGAMFQHRHINTVAQALDKFKGMISWQFLKYLPYGVLYGD